MCGVDGGRGGRLPRNTRHTRACLSGVKTPVFPCRTRRGLEARATCPSPGLCPGLRSTKLLIKWLRFKILTSPFPRQPHPQSEFPLPLGKMPSRSISRWQTCSTREPRAGPPPEAARTLRPELVLAASLSGSEGSAPRFLGHPATHGAVARGHARGHARLRQLPCLRGVRAHLDSRLPQTDASF